MIGDSSVTMMGTNNKKMCESPSKYISIPGSKGRRAPLFPERPNSQPDHALSLDLSACSPGPGQTLYESPDPQMPLPSPQTPRICGDSSSTGRGFLYELPPSFEQNDLSNYQQGQQQDLGSMDQLDLGWGLKPSTSELAPPHFFMEEDELFTPNFADEPNQAMNQSASENMMEDAESFIMTDCMLSSANISSGSETSQQQTSMDTTTSASAPQKSWHQPAMMSPPVSLGVAPLTPEEKPTLHTLLMSPVAPQSVAKPPQGLSFIQRSPILSQQLSKSAPEPMQFTFQSAPNLPQGVGVSAAGMASAAPPLIVSSNGSILAPVQLLSPIVVQASASSSSQQQQQQQRQQTSVFIQRGKPSATTTTKATATPLPVPVVEKVEASVEASPGTSRGASVGPLGTVKGKRRSISPRSATSGGSVEMTWNDIMELVEAEAESETKVKVEPQDVAFNPTDQLESHGEEDYESDAGSDNDNDDNSDAESVTSHSSFVDEFIASGKKEKRFFWQYNMQSKGPKGKRLCKSVESSDPHVLNDFEDPVFDPELNEMRYKHNGKARRGDGNDVTPSPRKLFTLGTELNHLNKQITCMTPVSELPAPARTTCRREKNKFASRACRLKKKAQHEANKLKLHGLAFEHNSLMLTMANFKHSVLKYMSSGVKPESGFSHRLDMLYKKNLRSMIAGNTPDYVNSVLMKVGEGDPTGGIYDDEQDTNVRPPISGRGLVNCDSWA